MMKELEIFQISVMIDNQYSIIGCMDKECQQFIGMKCYDAFGFINKDDFIHTIDKTMHNQNEQQISVDSTNGMEISVITTPVFSPSMSVVTCRICSKQKNAGVIDTLDLEKQLEKTQYVAVLDMVRLIPIAAIVLDPNDHFKYLEWNKFAEEMSGIKRSDAIGKTCFDFYNLKQAQKYHKEDIEAIESRKMVIEKNEYQFSSCCEDESKYLKTYKMPIYDRNNEPLLLVVVNVDITDSVLEEKELLKTEKLSLVGQLASGIAHNIGNQLSTMTGALSVIKVLDKEQAYAKYTNYIKMAIDHSSELIHQLLVFGRENNFNQKEINVHDILESTVEMVQCFFKKNIIIQTKLDASWPYVKGNASRIQNTVLNMLINARDAMPSGGVIRIITSNDEEKDMVCIRIEDDGEGMDQAVADKVFDPFFTTKKVGEGTGMGLATAYGNIKQMNGSINVNSCKGVGTAFTIRLPITKEVKAS